ncbi:MAG: DUF402 domain-containing protein [Actinomycetota bacterium]|nr:DUF402 domain-containing protein [Actinomycetota bacterium]
MDFGLNKFVSPRHWDLNKTPIDTRPVLLRHVTVGRIAMAMGVREVAAGTGVVVLHVADGTNFKSARAPDGSKQRSLTEWVLADASWSGGEALHVVRLDEWFSVICMWQHQLFAGWHVNFQRPLLPSALGWDTEDLVLDIEVAPDGSWSLEDQEDFERAVDEGHIDGRARAAVLREVDEAIGRLNRAEAPFSEDWTVRPYVRLEPVPLPDGWDVLPG